MLYLIVATMTGITTVFIGEFQWTVHLTLKNTNRGPRILGLSPGVKVSNAGGGKQAVHAGMVTTMVKVNGFYTLLCILKANPVTQ